MPRLREAAQPEERIKEIADRFGEALPSVLDSGRALSEEIHQRTLDLRTALQAIPDVPEFAAVRAQIAAPVALVALVRSVLNGEESAARMHDLVRDFDKARRAASRAARKAG